MPEAADTGMPDTLPTDTPVSAMDLEKRILVVDDDPGIRELIGDFLATHGFQVAVAADGAAMREAMAATRFDLIVLDVMMPGEDGLTILRSLDIETAPAVILMSVMGSDVDRIIGLELGADDYLAKPYNPRELLARIRAVLRRRALGKRDAAPVAADDDAHALVFADWRLEPATRLLFDPDGTPVTLTDGEFRLLLTFAERPRRVLSRDMLLDLSRGPTADHFDRAIDVQISRLRRKLSRAGTEEMIRTVRNEGYLFVPGVSRC